MVDSDLPRQQLVRRGIECHRIFVSRPGAAAFQPDGCEPDGSLLGLYVGHLKPQKRVAELPEIWARAFLSPSHEEGFRMAELDALSLGLPVVAWRLSALQEHSDKAVDRVNEGDLKTFARRAPPLVIGDDLFTRRRNLAIRAAQQFDWATTARVEHTLLIDQLVQSKLRYRRTRVWLYRRDNGGIR